MNAAASDPPSQPGAPVGADIRRRNRLLGLALLALYIALVVLFFIMFTHKGLPKDPDEMRREQAHEQAARAVGTGEHTAP